MVYLEVTEYERTTTIVFKDGVGQGRGVRNLRAS